MSSAEQQDYNRLLAQVRTELVGLTDAMVRQQAFLVFKDFFRSTKLWQESISVPVVANVVTYPLISTETGTIESILAVQNSSGQPVRASAPRLTTLLLAFPVSTSDTFTVTVSKTVGSPIDKTGLPEIPVWVLDKCGDYIFHGIVARLTSQPRKPYSDLATSKIHQQKYLRGVIIIRSEVLHQNTYGANAWSYPQDWRVNGQRGGVSTTGFGFTS